MDTVKEETISFRTEVGQNSIEQQILFELLKVKTGVEHQMHFETFNILNDLSLIIAIPLYYPFLIMIREVPVICKTLLRT